MIVRELVTKLGFQYDATPVKKADADTNALRGKLENLLSLFTAGAIANGFKNLVYGAVEVGSRLNDTAEQFGISTEALQRFQYTAGLAGVKAEQFNAAMGPLSRQIFAAGEGSKEAASLFHKFGIAFQDAHGKALPTEEVIGNIADRISKMKDPAEQAGLAMKFFGRSGARLVPILKQGREGLRQAGLGLDRLGGPISKEAIEALDTLGDRTDEVHTAFTNLKVTIASTLVPAFTWLATTAGSVIGQFRHIVEHSKIAQTAFVALGAVLTFFALRSIVALAPVLLPILGIAAGVTALTLLFDELWVTLEGGDSLLNRFVKWCMDSNAEATGLLGTIKEIGKTIFGLGDKVYDLLHPNEARQGKDAGRNNGSVQAKYTSEDGSTLVDENGRKLERKTEGVGPWGMFGKRTYYVPAGAPPGGDINDLAPMGAGGEGGWNTLGPGNINDLAPMNRPQSNATSIKNDVKIEVHPSQGMDEEALAVHTKRLFDAHLTTAVKNARAANLPSVASGSR